MDRCMLCPRECGADREKERGFCGGGKYARAARAALHFWEEPCISGEKGSGTVFFSGCPLKCCFCQNYGISSGNFGKDITDERLGRIFLELQEKGAHNINLVSPTQYVPQIISALDGAQGRLDIPIVYNTGGYEKAATIDMLKGYANVYLTDIKYMDSALSGRYSGAEDYFEYASKAIIKMREQAGKTVFGSDGTLKSGVIARHMVMPGMRKDSLSIVKWLSENFARDDILVSVMSQYTPMRINESTKSINRKITTFEYESVVEAVKTAGFEGYVQERTSASEKYTPDFDLEGI